MGRDARTYMVSIAIVGSGVGGLRSVLQKLSLALKREGFNIYLLKTSKRFRSLKEINEIKKYDVVIFSSSAFPTHIFINNVKFLLFIHGYRIHELMNHALRYQKLSIISGLYSLAKYIIFSKYISKIDRYICHSITTCEANMIKDRYIVLPQFVFSEELKNFRSYIFNNSTIEKKYIRLVTYYSFVDSPRLLNDIQLLKLLKIITSNINKLVEFILVDPRQHTTSIDGKIGHLIVKRIPFQPRNQFMTLLASADLYIERCIDEELRMGSIDAALVGTPIAKLTHPAFTNRQDYDDEILWASSVKGFADSIKDYILNIDYWKPYYSKKLTEFLVRKRNWDNIKQPLLEILRS
jgi:hypothetical protein